MFGISKVSKPYKTVSFIQWHADVPNLLSHKKDLVFTFLNITEDFKDGIDWNYKSHGKLWTDNLNYFNFLNQEGFDKDFGLKLIENYVENDTLLNEGKEPYNISLRGVNWIRFLSKYKINNQLIHQRLYDHYQILLKNLEYHLLGNHLLENGFSLLFGAYYFKDEDLYGKAIKIMTLELNEEILKDGAHFECSPMYHQIIFHRLLDCIQLLQLNTWKKDGFLEFLKEKASLMLSWLSEVTYTNGNVPMVNDAAYGIAQGSITLMNYANKLNVINKNIALSDSGYRKMVKQDLEVFLDVGNIQPSYQPGHNHADTFNFELYYKGKPVIVDVGTSTYEKNVKRQLERSTISHNTVTINKENSSNVWGGFRVAQRAKVEIIEDMPFKVSATHNGYLKKQRILHQRTFDFNQDDFIIKDKVQSAKAEARLHFHPSITDIKINAQKLELPQQNLEFKLESEKLELSIEDYDFCHGFNTTEKATCIVVKFCDQLTTTLSKN